MPDFEKYVDDKVLSRGLSYFKNGHVTYCEEIAPGEFEAEVEGLIDEIRRKSRWVNIDVLGKIYIT